MWFDGHSFLVVGNTVLPTTMEREKDSIVEILIIWNRGECPLGQGKGCRREKITSFTQIGGVLVGVTETQEGE